MYATSLIHFSLAILDHSGQDLSGILPLVGLLLDNVELLLELVKLSKPSLNRLLSDAFFLFLVLDLLLGASALDASFQHVGTVALGGYGNEKKE